MNKSESTAQEQSVKKRHFSISFMCHSKKTKLTFTSCDELVQTDSFGDGTLTRLLTHLFDPVFGAGHRVVQAVVLVDDLPQLGEGVVLLQRVGAFGLEILEHGRFSHRPVHHVRLSGEIPEGPAGADASESFGTFERDEQIFKG